jgi:hypothetical protein
MRRNRTGAESCGSMIDASKKSGRDRSKRNIGLLQSLKLLDVLSTA